MIPETRRIENDRKSLFASDTCDRILVVISLIALLEQFLRFCIVVAKINSSKDMSYDKNSIRKKNNNYYLIVELLSTS